MVVSSKEVKAFLEKADHSDIVSDVLTASTFEEACATCLLAGLSPQSFGHLLEKWIAQTFDYAKDKEGDVNIHGRSVELKVSLGGKTRKRFNFVQLRLNRDIDFLLVAYHLSKENVQTLGETYLFYVPNKDMKHLLRTHGSLAHGKKAEMSGNSFQEKALRPVLGDAAWNALCAFQIANFPNSEKKLSMDKFYTLPAVAAKCVATLEQFQTLASFDCVVEPSCGNGNWLSYLPVSTIAIDIAPEAVGALQEDFLLWLPPRGKKNVLVVGNPPFGRVSSMAIKFFNHAASFANVIAFIVPRTFRRKSVQNRLHLKFHLEVDEDISSSPCAFVPKMAAKCCFQIWAKKSELRERYELPTEHRDWTFLSYGPLDALRQPTPPRGADFAIRAYGGKCGQIISEHLEILRPKSWHWIRANIDKDLLASRFSQLDFAMSYNTARQNSMGRGDLVQLYSEMFDDM